MPDFLAMGGDNSVVSAEVTNWYSAEVRLKLGTKVRQSDIYTEWKEIKRNHLLDNS